MLSKLKDASQRNSVKTPQDNFELQRKWRNEATKERRKAIRQYWKNYQIMSSLIQESSIERLDHSLTSRTNRETAVIYA